MKICSTNKNILNTEFGMPFGMLFRWMETMAMCVCVSAYLLHTHTYTCRNLYDGIPNTKPNKKRKNYPINRIGEFSIVCKVALMFECFCAWMYLGIVCESLVIMILERASARSYIFTHPNIVLDHIVSIFVWMPYSLSTWLNSWTCINLWAYAHPYIHTHSQKLNFTGRETVISNSIFRNATRKCSNQMRIQSPSSTTKIMFV